MLEWLRYTHTFVFVGYSFGDYDLNRAWHDVRAELGKLSNWAFATWPGCSSEEVHLWRQRYVELLDCTFSELMQGLSYYVGTKARETRKSSNRQERTAAVEALASTLRNVDPYEYEGALQVAELARQVGMSLGLSEADIADLYDAALLRDIGKLSIPDSIKKKPGPLDESEWQVLKRHVATSARVVEEIPSLHHLADVILRHHEYLDGSGYPDGAKGEDIPLLSRIITICGSYTSMVTNRPYRKAYSLEEALRVLVKYSKSMFEKEIVRALRNVLARDSE